MNLFLLFMLIAPHGNHWIKLKDSYRVHAYYVDHYGNLIGSYYQPPKPSKESKRAVPFTAQCLEGKQVELETEIAAKGFVESCPSIQPEL